jgi:hypothetical protein
MKKNIRSVCSPANPVAIDSGRDGVANSVPGANKGSRRGVIALEG